MSLLGNIEILQMVTWLLICAILVTGAVITSTTWISNRRLSKHKPIPGHRVLDEIKERRFDRDADRFVTKLTAAGAANETYSSVEQFQFVVTTGRHEERKETGRWINVELQHLMRKQCDVLRVILLNGFVRLELPNGKPKGKEYQYGGSNAVERALERAVGFLKEYNPNTDS